MINNISGTIAGVILILLLIIANLMEPPAPYIHARNLNTLGYNAQVLQGQCMIREHTRTFPCDELALTDTDVEYLYPDQTKEK